MKSKKVIQKHLQNMKGNCSLGNIPKLRMTTENSVIDFIYMAIIGCKVNSQKCPKIKEIKTTILLEFSKYLLFFNKILGVNHFSLYKIFGYICEQIFYILQK